MPLSFVVCLKSDDEVDLEPRKIYQVLDDDQARQDGYLRIVDESGEDYLYPANLFAPVKLAQSVARDLASA